MFHTVECVYTHIQTVWVCVCVCVFVCVRAEVQIFKFQTLDLSFGPIVLAA